MVSIVDVDRAFQEGSALVWIPDLRWLPPEKACGVVPLTEEECFLVLQSPEREVAVQGESLQIFLILQHPGEKTGFGAEIPGSTQDPTDTSVKKAPSLSTSNGEGADTSVRTTQNSENELLADGDDGDELQEWYSELSNLNVDLQLLACAPDTASWHGRHTNTVYRGSFLYENAVEEGAGDMPYPSPAYALSVSKETTSQDTRLKPRVVTSFMSAGCGMTDVAGKGVHSTYFLKLKQFKAIVYVLHVDLEVDSSMLDKGLCLMVSASPKPQTMSLPMPLSDNGNSYDVMLKHLYEESRGVRSDRPVRQIKHTIHVTQHIKVSYITRFISNKVYVQIELENPLDVPMYVIELCLHSTRALSNNGSANSGSEFCTDMDDEDIFPLLLNPHERYALVRVVRPMPNTLLPNLPNLSGDYLSTLSIAWKRCDNNSKDSNSDNSDGSDDVGCSSSRVDMPCNSVLSQYDVYWSRPIVQDLLISLECPSPAHLNTLVTIHVSITNLSNTTRELTLVLPPMYSQYPNSSISTYATTNNKNSGDMSGSISGNISVNKGGSLAKLIERVRGEVIEDAEVPQVSMSNMLSSTRPLCADYHLLYKSPSLLSLPISNAATSSDTKDSIGNLGNGPTDAFVPPLLALEMSWYLGVVEPNSSISGIIHFIALKEGMHSIGGLQLYDCLSNQRFHAEGGISIWVNSHN